MAMHDLLAIFSTDVACAPSTQNVYQALPLSTMQKERFCAWMLDDWKGVSEERWLGKCGKKSPRMA